jgi:hypothetical protein
VKCIGYSARYQCQHNKRKFGHTLLGEA